MSKSNISITAWLVIRCLLALHASKRFSGLVTQDAARFYRYCLDYCRPLSPLFKINRYVPVAFTAFWVDVLLARGATRHYALRKAAVQKFIDDARQKGATQLVVLGGGFDLCAFNNAKNHTSMTVFEIDTPGMHPHKLNVLRGHYGTLPPNFIGIPADLSEHRLDDVLLALPAFDAAKHTAYVAEGVSMYLRTADFIDLLERIRRLSGGHGDFIFTAMRDQSKMKHSVWQWFNKHILKSIGESLKFGVAPAEIGHFLSQHGYRLETLISYSDLQKDVVTPHELALLEKQNGEYIVYAHV